MTISSKKKRKREYSQAFRLSLIILACIAMLAVVSLFSSCKTIVKPMYVPVPVRHDSIVEKTVHDTVLRYLPQKQSVITKGKSYLKTDLAFSNAWIDSAGLHHDIANFGTVPAKVIHDKTLVHDSVGVPYPVIEYVDRPVEKIVYKHDFIWCVGLATIILSAGFILWLFIPKKRLLNLISKLFK